MIRFALMAALLAGSAYADTDLVAQGMHIHCVTGGRCIVESDRATFDAPRPTCPDGWTLVADLVMHPKCARELIEPTYR